jgi:hypothetical protein
MRELSGNGEVVVSTDVFKSRLPDFFAVYAASINYLQSGAGVSYRPVT